MKRRLQIEPNLPNIREACDFVVEAAEDAGLDARAVYHCEMAIDEACTNVVEHGFKGSRDGFIIITTEVANSCLRIVISDTSPPFDPTQREDPDVQSDFFKRQPGGWGIYFVKQLMDSVSYKHRNGQNHLTLKKCLPDAHSMDDERFPHMVTALPKGYFCIAPEGRLDSVSSPVLAQVLDDQLEQGHIHLILNLENVEYVSSSGLKVMASAWREANDQGGEVIITSMNQRVREVFDMVGFDTFYKVFPDVEAALSAVTD